MLLGVVQLCNRYYNHMTFEELKIQLDLNEPINVLKSIGKQIKDNEWFVVCDDGGCHLFDNDGNNIDIKNIKTLYEELIPKDIKKIIIPNSIKNIKDFVFEWCESLTLINIPDLVEHIGNLAFYNCKNLKSIIIPNSIKRIGYNAFYKCKNLKSLTFEGKTIDQVKLMKNYPFGIKDESIIKCI